MGTTLKGLGEQSISSTSKSLSNMIQPSKSFALTTGGVGGGSKLKTGLEYGKSVVLTKPSSGFKDFVGRGLTPRATGGLSYGMASVIKPSTKGLFASSTIPAFKQSSGLKTKQKQTFKSVFAPSASVVPSGFSSSFSSGWDIPLVFPLKPSLGGARGRKKPKRRKASRKTIYTPTIAAQTYGLTATSIPKSYYGGAGGLGGRPQIVKKKAKKKTKSKKKRK